MEEKAEDEVSKNADGKDDKETDDKKDKKEEEKPEMIPFDDLISQTNSCRLWSDGESNPFGLWKLGIFTAVVAFANFY